MEWVIIGIAAGWAAMERYETEIGSQPHSARCIAHHEFIGEDVCDCGVLAKQRIEARINEAKEKA